MGSCGMPFACHLRLLLMNMCCICKRALGACAGACRGAGGQWRCRVCSGARGAGCLAQDRPLQEAVHSRPGRTLCAGTGALHAQPQVRHALWRTWALFSGTSSSDASSLDSDISSSESDSPATRHTSPAQRAGAARSTTVRAFAVRRAPARSRLPQQLLAPDVRSTLHVQRPRAGSVQTTSRRHSAVHMMS